LNLEHGRGFLGLAMLVKRKRVSLTVFSRPETGGTRRTGLKKEKKSAFGSSRRRLGKSESWVEAHIEISWYQPGSKSSKAMTVDLRVKKERRDCNVESEVEVEQATVPYRSSSPEFDSAHLDRK